MIDGSVEKWQQADEEVRNNLPPGVKLARTLRGHTDTIGRIAWSPNGQILASPSIDKTIRLWNTETGECLHTLEGHQASVYCVAFDPLGRILASGSEDSTIKIWDSVSGKLLRTLKGHQKGIYGLVFGSQGQLISGGFDGTIKFWKIVDGCLLKTLDNYGMGSQAKEILELAFDPRTDTLAGGGNSGILKLWNLSNGLELEHNAVPNGFVATTAFDPNGSNLAAAGSGGQILLWETATGRLVRTLELHTDVVTSVRFSSDGTVIAAKGWDDIVSLWMRDSGALLAKISTIASRHNLPGVVFHPHLPMLAIVSSDPEAKEEECNCVISILELDLDGLLNKHIRPTVTYTSAKIVLVGDSGVGKTGLGWRLAHEEFKEHSSTHGQQFWLLSQLCKQRSDGAQCEAVLWDLAGQPDYRLIHALFLDDTDLALLLFDPTHNDNPLSGIEFWLKQLKVENKPSNGTPTFLVAARSDRGTPRLTNEELDTFCIQRGIKGYILTSAKSGEGIKELLKQMQSMIAWDDKPATVTTKTFKRIKDFVLDLKEKSHRRRVILTPKELRQRLRKTDRKWEFSDAEMLTAVGHLENHGYVTRLKTSQGELRILLTPELLNNLAASFVLEARRNQKGLGSLEEQLLRSGEYKFPELEKLTEVEQDILLGSVAVLFLEHNICFRETDPLNGRTYLVFPELINLKKPLIGDDIPIEDGVAYTVSGAVENVYASLVVLMGYTQNFTRTNQWRNHARYEVGKDRVSVCGFRIEEERAGELDFVLYFGTNTPTSFRTLFQGLFESFLARRDLAVRRIEQAMCSNGHTLNRAVVREYISSGEEFAFCNRCGERIELPKADQPIRLTNKQAEEVKASHRSADQRSRFEQVLFRLKSYSIDEKITSPECFISYAWGNPKQELWVERSLAADLQKAGVKVVLDRWHNPPGSSIGRFIDRLEKVDRIIVVGTAAYRKKYDNEDPESGTVVAAECTQINTRMRGPEKRKSTIIPVLLEGTATKSFPPCLSDQVFSDFRKPEAYFCTALELLLSLYQVPPQQPVAIELRELLVGQKEF